MIDFVKEARALSPYTQSIRRDFRFLWRGAGARHSFDAAAAVDVLKGK